MKLARVIVGVDFCVPSAAAARWTALHFAPDAEIVLIHAVDIPRPPVFLRGRFPPHEELVKTARIGAERRFEQIGPWTQSERIVTDVSRDERQGRSSSQATCEGRISSPSASRPAAMGSGDGSGPPPNSSCGMPRCRCSWFVA